MTLSALDAIHARYSCRAFTDQMPSPSDLETIAKAAVASPSAMNRQPWRVIVVRDQALLADMEAEGMKNLANLPDPSAYQRIMSRGGKLFYHAPCMMVIPVDHSNPSNWAMLDCGIVTENIALAAASLGINSLICGLALSCFSGDQKASFQQRLGFPQGYELGIAVLLGYASQPEGTPHQPDFAKISWIG